MINNPLQYTLTNCNCKLMLSPYNILRTTKTYQSAQELLHILNYAKINHLRNGTFTKWLQNASNDTTTAFKVFSHYGIDVCVWFLQHDYLLTEDDIINMMDVQDDILIILKKIHMHFGLNLTTELKSKIYKQQHPWIITWMEIITNNQEYGNQQKCLVDYHQTPLDLIKDKSNTNDLIGLLQQAEIYHLECGTYDDWLIIDDTSAREAFCLFGLTVCVWFLDHGFMIDNFDTILAQDDLHILRVISEYQQVPPIEILGRTIQLTEPSITSNIVIDVN